jgi:hypothetical protein
MISTRRTSITTGGLFIVATVAALAAAAVVPSLTGTDYLTAVADQPNRLAFAALLYLIAAGSSVGIVIALYPFPLPDSRGCWPPPNVRSLQRVGADA